MSEADPSDELLELTRALSAHVAWHVECGASGLPRATQATWTERGAPEPAPAPRGPSERTAEPRPRPPARPAELAPPEPRVARAAGATAPNDLRQDLPRTEARPVVVPPPTPLTPSTPGPSEEAHRRLAVLAQEVSGCTKCALHSGRKQTVFARGTGKSRLCFVGEGPGADEDQQGFPFVGAAGQLLDRMIAAMGFDRDEVYVCNIVKCRPPNNRKPEPDEMAACAPYLDEQLRLIDPEVIVALGATAVEGLFGPSVGITKLRGRFKLYKGSIAVMPTFHPAYLLRNPAAKKDVWSDLQQVMRQLGREPSKR